MVKQQQTPTTQPPQTIKLMLNSKRIIDLATKQLKELNIEPNQENIKKHVTDALIAYYKNKPAKEQA